MLSTHRDLLDSETATPQSAPLKVDLCMWTFNGEHTLPQVLKRISQVIPSYAVNQRLAVDDGSTDDTVKILEKQDWTVVPNEGKGIGDGANTALKNVETAYFVSFEQDIVISEDWWDKIPKLLNDRVVIASGVRLPNEPVSLRKLEEYTTERYRLETEHKTSFLYGKTLDNTIYKTEAIKAIGGFSTSKVNAGVDNILAKHIQDCGLEWKVDFNVKSTHLRRGLLDELRHCYWYGTCQKELRLELGEAVDGFWPILLRTGFSPIRGLQVACKKKCWQIAYVYPLLRITTFLGVSAGSLS